MMSYSSRCLSNLIIQLPYLPLNSHHYFSLDGRAFDVTSAPTTSLNDPLRV